MGTWGRETHKTQEHRTDITPPSRKARPRAQGRFYTLGGHKFMLEDPTPNKKHLYDHKYDS